MRLSIRTSTSVIMPQSAVSASYQVRPGEAILERYGLGLGVALVAQRHVACHPMVASTAGSFYLTLCSAKCAFRDMRIVRLGGARSGPGAVPSRDGG
jgi:hypothetical protein